MLSQIKQQNITTSKLLTEHTLASCEFSETDILQIINSQDSNRAHGHDMINILVLTLCD